MNARPRNRFRRWRRDEIAAVIEEGGWATSITGAQERLLPTAATGQAEQSVGLPRADFAGWSNGYASAPEYDEEHPEELFYRPFPLAPLLTASASPDDEALARMWEPDVAATLDMLDDELVALPMTFKPAGRAAALLWAQQFSGKAVTATADPRRDSPAGLESRRVKTSMR
jgi:hypothetical protein